MQEATEKPPLQECNSCSFCTCVHNLGLSPVNMKLSWGRMFVQKYTSVGRGSGCTSAFTFVGHKGESSCRHS